MPVCCDTIDVLAGIPVPITSWPGTSDPVSAETVSVVPDATPVNDPKTQFAVVIFVADPSDVMAQNPAGVLRRPDCADAGAANPHAAAAAMMYGANRWRMLAPFQANDAETFIGPVHCVETYPDGSVACSWSK